MLALKKITLNIFCALVVLLIRFLLFIIENRRLISENLFSVTATLSATKTSEQIFILLNSPPTLLNIFLITVFATVFSVMHEADFILDNLEEYLYNFLLDDSDEEEANTEEMEAKSA